jgi:predicted phosphodiesterase
MTESDDNEVRIDPRSRLLILSDIHGNWTALRAVLGAEPEVSDILCLGDWVNYGPDPSACVRWGSRNLLPGRALRGNHDVAALTGIRPRFSSTGGEELDAVLSHTRRNLSIDDRAYLESLPASATLRVGHEIWWACHALPSDPLEGYLREESPETSWRDEVSTAGDPAVLLVGHTHRPFLKRVGKTTIVNPGSVGRPKDGDSLASYAIWQDGEFYLRKISCDVQEVDLGYSTHFHGLHSQHASTNLSRRSGERLPG